MRQFFTTILTADQVVAWLLTYTVHSTLLLGAAWAVSRWLGGRRLRLQETIWRFALAGALVSATAQLALGGLGHAPLAGRWALALTTGPADAAPSMPQPRHTNDLALPAATMVAGQEGPALAAGKADAAAPTVAARTTQASAGEGRLSTPARTSAPAASTRRPEGRSRMPMNTNRVATVIGTDQMRSSL